MIATVMGFSGLSVLASLFVVGGLTFSSIINNGNPPQKDLPDRP